MLWGILIGAGAAAAIAVFREGRATSQVKVITEEKRQLKVDLGKQKKVCDDHLKALELALAAVPSEAPGVAVAEVEPGPKRDARGRFLKAPK